ncbi:reverse transcriptase domain-containing protein [Tanacetum coccineum]
MSVRLAYRSFQYPIGIAENMLIEVGKFTSLVDFVILEMEEDKEDFNALLDEEEIPFEKITFDTDYKIKKAIDEPPTDIELKPLPNHLEYAFLEEPSFLPVIISSQLSEQNKNKLISVLKKHKQAFAWKTIDIPGNAPAFQRCMMTIFHDMIEESIEVFMENFFVFGNYFDNCLNNLDKMLQHCKDANLVLNWEKCHLMVKEGIVLGHKVSGAGLEVDKAKIDVISKLPPPTNVKGIRSFMGHADFYRRFIKDFSKIARPLTKLLEKDTPFEFNNECHKALNFLKEKLTCTLVIISPNWNISFELMCDASEFAVGLVLGQKMENTFTPSILQVKLSMQLSKSILLPKKNLWL